MRDTMNLYILRPIKDWEPGYDKCFGFVVRATSIAAARSLVSRHAEDEGSAVWKDPADTTCVLLSTEGNEEIVLRDFSSA